MINKLLLAGAVIGALVFTRALAAESQSFFLPQNPVAAAYVLGRLSNQELIAAPRGEAVFIALLKRAGLERKYRAEALEGLAKLRKTDPLTELLNGLIELDKAGDVSANSITDLSQILLQTKPVDLTGKRKILEALAAESQLALTRQIGFAGIVTADGSVEPAWKGAEPNPARLADLLLALPLLRDSTLASPAYSRITPLLKQDSNPDLRRAAITAISVAPGHETETFKMLSEVIQSGIERTAAIASLQRLPQKSWPKDDVVPLIDSLMQYLQTVPPDERTGAEFSAGIQFATELSSFLPEEKSRRLTKRLRDLGPAVIVLRAVYEQLRYDKQLVVVEAGKPVALILENQDAMPHNLAILAPGTLEEIGTAAEKMGPEADSQGRLYIPASPKVLHATKLAAPGQKIQLAFDAPAEPGEYPYVCTFPGHWRRMSGVMAVVKDVEAYLGNHAQSEQPKVTEWKLENLAPELSKAAFGRNLENGKKFFIQLACAQCHKLDKEGYAYGPDLTGVFVRYKNDRASVLQQILEPSKIIEERYRNISFELKGTEPIAGMVLKEDPQTVTLQTGPADSLIQTLKKPEILRRELQSSSLMPIGLLNNLSKEQIFDLLAYIESNGNIESHKHDH